MTSWRNATASVWTGRILSGLFIAFMLFASVFPKFFLPQIAFDTLKQLEWPPKYLMLIAGIELVGTILYLIPRTAVFGAVLLTGLLGGAMATQIRIENPLFSHILFGLYLGLMMWGGLWLRDGQLRSLFPFRAAE